MQAGQWSGFTKLCWLVMITGILIATGAWPWALLAAGLLTAFSVILAAVHSSTRAAGRRAEDEALRSYFSHDAGKEDG